MSPKKAVLLGRFKKFCVGLSRRDRIAILYHCDADGFAAGLITAKAVEKLTGKKAAFLFDYKYGSKKNLADVAKKLKGKKAGKVIFVDLNIDQFPREIKKISEFAEILIIDHHKEYHDLNSKKIVFLKAGHFAKMDPSSYTAAKFSFDLFSKVADIPEMDWVACLGILGDMGFAKWKPFFRAVEKRRKISLKNLRGLVDIVSATTILEEKKLPQLFKEFYGTKNPKKLLSCRFSKNVKLMKIERDKWVLLFRKKAEYYPDRGLYFFEIRPKYDMKSAIIDALTLKYPGKTLIISEVSGNRAKFSARRQDFKIKMNSLLECAVRGIKGGNAGGHIPASAGSVPKTSFRKFKENLLACALEQPK